MGYFPLWTITYNIYEGNIMRIAIFGYGIIGQAIKKLLDDSALMFNLSHLDDRLVVRAYDI